jgi:outer membrane protein assembly factor BamA
VQVNFSDLLGDHRVQVNSNSVETFTNFSARYLNFKHRFNWGAQVIDYRDYYLLPVSQQDYDREQATRLTGAMGLFQYPFSRYYRMDLGGGVFSRSFNQLYINPLTGQLTFDKLKDNIGQLTLSFSGDTVRYQRFGPFQGKRFNIGVGYDKFFSGDSEGGVVRYTTDFRAYRRVTRRSLLAFRVAGIIQDAGESAFSSIYTLGGINQLRGYRFREFYGDNVAFANIEFRFPLVDSFRLPFGLDLGPIRGFWYTDVGTAWFTDATFCSRIEQQPFNPADPDSPLVDVCTELGQGNAFVDPETGHFLPWNFYDSENKRLLHGKASTGLGFNFFIGPLQLHWVFSKLYDLEEFGPWHMDFYIAYDF